MRQYTDAPFMEPAEYDRMQAVEDSMWWYRAAHATILDALRQAPGPPAAPLLDAGCGTGGLLRRLALAPADRPLVGLDASPEAAASAQRRSGCPIVVGTVDDLPFPAATFGVILSIDVLSHRRVDPPVALAEAYRCLLPGGILVLNLPAFAWLSSYHDAHVHNARRFDRVALGEQVAAAGFTPIRIAYWNSLLFPLMVIRRKCFGSGRAASDVTAYPAAVDRMFGGLLALERAGARRGVRYPFGGSLLVIARK